MAEFFAATVPTQPALEPSWNVAPTDDIYVVREDGDVSTSRRLDICRWGLLPNWAAKRRMPPMINARSETLATNGAFRAAFEHRRCIVPADGYYEWRPGPGRTRQAVYIARTDGEPLAFAALWANASATIVTTQASASLAAWHNRMPVVLDSDHWAEWLDPANEDLLALSTLLVPAPDDALSTRLVGPAVNSVANNGPELLRDFAMPTGLF